MKVGTLVPPSQIVCLAPRSGKLLPPSPRLAPLSEVNTTKVFSYSFDFFNACVFNLKTSVEEKQRQTLLKQWCTHWKLHSHTHAHIHADGHTHQMQTQTDTQIILVRLTVTICFVDSSIARTMAQKMRLFSVLNWSQWRWYSCGAWSGVWGAWCAK